MVRPDRDDRRDVRSSGRPAEAAVRIEGKVEIGGGAVAGSTVSLWAASADAPSRLTQVTTDADGGFVVSVEATPTGASSLYLVASGGTPAVSKAGGDNKEIDLLVVLGNDPPPKVVVNELTTVASAFTAARFINGQTISGNPLGLHIAAGNAPNLVDPVTGGWGKVASGSAEQHPNHDANHPRYPGFAHHRVRHRAERRLARALLQGRDPAGGPAPTNTLEAMAGIAREPWADPADLFALFERSLSAAQGWRPPRGTVCALPCSRARGLLP